MKPVIGMTAMANEDCGKVYRCNQTYVHAILNAGGIPVLLPSNGADEHYAALAEKLDGLLIPGGADVNPLLYGEEAVPQVTMARSADDTFEFAMIHAMAKLNKPILGICRGVQVINTAFGGTLWQDIPSQYETNICHRQSGPRYEAFHYVNLEKGTRMADIFGLDKLAVNTYHHQAVKDVAEGFQVCGRANDGLIEAIEHKEKYIMGVQWHPECMVDVHKEYEPLFKDFIREASK